jgi:hypothetical protein
MSFYASIQGRIHYPTADSYYAMVETLKCGAWLSDDGYLLDEMGHHVEDDDDALPNANDDTLTITIPQYHWRNLARIDFFVAGAAGWIVGTSTDGCFDGWFIRGYGGKTWDEETFDLHRWASAYSFGKDAPDIDTDFDAYCEWQSEVEQHFFDAYAGL